MSISIFPLVSYNKATFPNPRRGVMYKFKIDPVINPCKNCSIESESQVGIVGNLQK